MYSVRYNCSNCGHNFSKEFPKGQKATFTIVCPSCECWAAEKDCGKPDREVDYIPFPFPYPYYYPRPEPRKPQWEWPKYDYKFMCATDTREAESGSILDTILIKYSGAWEKLAEM